VPLWWNRPIEDVPTKIAFRWQTLPDGWIFISANANVDARRDETPNPSDG